MSDFMPSKDSLNKGRNLAVDRITIGVLAALTGKGVEAILLKGPTHARWLYEPEHARTYSDTDLLVAPDAVGPAEEALAELGFELPPIYSDDERPGYEHAWVRRADGARVDLHWSLVGINADPQQAWEVLAAECTSFELHGTKVSALAENARALHVALHAAQHGSELGSAIDDLERAAQLERTIWERAYELAGRLDAVASFSAGLRIDPNGAIVADSLGVTDTIPTDVALRASAVSGYALSLRWFLSQKGVRLKTRLLLTNILPSPGFMREWSALARKGRLGLLLAYLWRPFHLFGKAAMAAGTLLRLRRESRR